MASDPMENSAQADNILLTTGVRVPDQPEPAFVWTYWNSAYWVWTDGAYRRLQRQEALHLVLAWLMRQGVSSSSKRAELVLDALAAKVQTFGPKLGGWIEAPKDLPPELARASWLPTANSLICPVGIASGVRGSVRGLDPRWFCTARLDYAYDREATCPRTLDWLRERIPDPELLEMFREFTGYWLTQDQGQQAVLVIAGQGKSGKSTLMNVVTSMLGPANVSNVTLGPLFESVFDRSGTDGKLLNVCEETMERVSTRVENGLKQWTGGTPVSMQYKFGTIFSALPTARLVLVGNQWPKFRDPSDGTWRRLYGLPMNRIIDQVVPLFHHRLESERSGLLNWAIGGLANLVGGRLIRRPCQATEMFEDMREAGRHYQHFIEERVSPAAGGFVATDTLWAVWQSYAGDAASTMTPAKLVDEVCKLVPGAKRARPQIEGERRRGVLEIKIT